MLKNGKIKRHDVKCYFCENIVNAPVNQKKVVCPGCRALGKKITKVVHCIGCGVEAEVPLQHHNSYVCPECKEKGVISPQQISGKKGSEIRNQKLKEDPEYKKRYIQNISQSLKKTFEEKKEEIVQKRKETYKRKTGYDHNMHNPESKQKLKKTVRKRYNVDNVMQLPEIRDKFTGSNNPAVREEVKSKISEALKGRESKLKGKTYEEIFGEERAEEIRKEKSETLRSKFLPDLKYALDYLELKLLDPEYVDAHFKHRWKCLKCGHEFTQIWNAIQQGYTCPKCYPRNQGESKFEREVQEFISSLSLSIIKHDRTLISPKELDIVIHDKKVAIELNGTYFHSEACVNDKFYHLNKTISCEKVGYRLIHIFEDEWVYKKDIVKARLKQILGVSDSIKINARECEIKTVDTETKNEFLKKFHLQGPDIGSLVRLGAFYNDELVAIMTFSQSNITKGFRKQPGVWELNRFCSDYKYNVRGVAGKLLEYFKKNYDWVKIFTYADRRWSTGNLYKQLGFRLVGTTDIDYWYTKGFKRISRWELRKRPDEPKGIPEYILRAKEGYIRVYGCGNLKFELVKEETLKADSTNSCGYVTSKKKATHHTCKTTKVVHCISCGAEAKVPLQHHNSYVCPKCKSKGITSPQQISGKKGAQIRNQKLQDLNYQKQFRQSVSEGLRKASSQNKEEIAQKRKETYRKRTGYDHPMHNPEVKEKVKQTCIDRYGVTAPLKNKEILEKVKQTNLKRYGVETLLQDKNFRKEIEKRYLEKHGVRHWTQTKEGKEHLREIGLKRHNQSREEILKQLGITLVDREYQNSHYHHVWRCSNCGKTFKTCWNNIQQGYLCPHCYPRSHGYGQMESEIFKFISDLVPCLVIRNDRKLISPYELDIYVPEKKFALEFNGLFWHTSENIDPWYHRKKTDLCRNEQVRLIHVFEDEWIHKKEIVKHRIKNILGVSTGERVYARNCIIKEVNQKTKNEFLLKYHIQGTDISKIRLGAFYNNELVAVMTFSKPSLAKGQRISEEGIWELNRFCTNYNFNVVGVAGKLLEYFKRNYEWSEIYSYADLRWSYGNLYKQLGFEHVSTTSPNYWYVKGYKRFHRFSLRKRPDEPENVSEQVLRLKEGYRILWDCGNLKFRLTKED